MEIAKRIAKLRAELDHRKKTLGKSVDDQLILAELEYHLMKEEMALLHITSSQTQIHVRGQKTAPCSPDVLISTSQVAANDLAFQNRRSTAKEASNLRQELTSVVLRLNQHIAENKRLRDECEELRSENRRLERRLLSVQGLLLCLCRTLEKTPADLSEISPLSWGDGQLSPSPEMSPSPTDTGTSSMS